MGKNAIKRMTGLLLGLALLTPAMALPMGGPLLVYAAEAKTEETMVVSYDEAVKMATKDLSNVLALEESIEPIAEQRDQLNDQLNLLRERVRIMNSKLPQNLPSSVTAKMYAPLRRAIKQLDRQIEIIKLNQEMIKTSTEMSLRNALVSVANSEWDLALTSATVALNEENARQVALRHQLGMVSDNDLRVAEQTLEQNRMNLETLNITLENERQALRRLLQIPLTQPVTVEYERNLEEPPADLNEYIKEKQKSEPTLKQKQIDVDIKKDEVTNQQDSKDEDLKESLAEEYDKSTRALNEAKRALEAAIRTNDNNINQLRMREESLQLDLQKAKDQYQATQANFDAGKATQYHLDSAALSITQSEIALEKNRNSLWTLQFAFEHPFMLAN